MGPAVSKTISEKVNEEQIQKEILESPVVVYTNSDCGYCTMAKELLDKERIVYSEHDLKKMQQADPEGHQISSRRIEWYIICRGLTGYEIAMEYFPKVDKNGDGKVDMAERKKLIKNFLELDLNENTTFELELVQLEKCRQQFFTKLDDLRKNFKQQKAEFDKKEALMRRVIDQLTSEINKSSRHTLPENVNRMEMMEQDGSITIEQFENFPENLEIIKQFVRDADKNGDRDGKATRQEMLDFLDSMKEKESGKKWEL